MDRLVSLPCHLIAKQIKEGDKESWRFSFSRQEVELATILPHNARLCYIGLKLIFKRHLKPIYSGLKSYHMLTLFFWFMERQDPTHWEDIGDFTFSFNTRLTSLLKFVAESLHSDCIPHYFIRTINLVQVMKVDEKERKALQDVAVTIQKMIEKDNFPGKYIFDQTAFHAMLLNRLGHEKVLSERWYSGIVV